MKCDSCEQPATWVLKEKLGWEYGGYENEEYRCEQCFPKIFVRDWKRIKPQPSPTTDADLSITSDA
jgi:hypothetical protein